MVRQFEFFQSVRDEEESAPLSLEGFRYRAEVIDSREENDLIAKVSELPFEEFDFHGFKGKRRVVSFGWRYDYSGGGLREAEDVPPFLLELRTRAASFGDLEPHSLQQVLVTE